MVAPEVPPGDFNVTCKGSKSAEVSWTPIPIEQQNGFITGYIVQAQNRYSTYKVSADKTSVEISDLSPFTSYTFEVSATTKAGTGPPACVSFKTPEAGKTHTCMHTTTSLDSAPL